MYQTKFNAVESPEHTDRVVIHKEHYEWLNHEVLRLGNLARSYWDRGENLKSEVDRLSKELENIRNTK